MTTCKLSPVALGLAFGVFWGASLLLLGLLTYFGYEGAVIAALRARHVGYDASVIGGILVGIVGFIEHFIYGAMLAWVYNLFANCCCKKDDKCD